MPVSVAVDIDNGSASTCIAMSASVSDPFLLASYRHKPSKRPGKERQTCSVLASHSIGGAADGYLTVAVQGDGVHVLDISAVRSVVSQSLGPSSSFSCRPVTHCVGSTYTTYAVPASSSDLDSIHAEKSIWKWTQDISGSNVGRLPKKSLLLSHDIKELHAHGNFVLAVSPFGQVTAVDSELNIVHTSDSPHPIRQLIQSFAFPSSTCDFAPTSSGTAVALLESLAESVILRVVGFTTEQGFSSLGEYPLPHQANGCLAFSCSSTGYMSCFLSDGSWHGLRLVCTPGAAEPSFTLSKQPPFRLKSLSFLPGQVSTLALGASHVLLAAPTELGHQIALHIWDMQYSVLLASHILPVPSSLETEEGSLKLSLCGTNSIPQRHAFLVLSSSTRSSILAVPLACPEVSTIASAMGRADAGRPWVDIDDVVSDATATVSLSSSETELVDEMRSFVQEGNTQAADELFGNWDSRVEASAFHHNLVVAFLKVALEPAMPLPETTRRLLKRGVVSNEMLSAELGVFGILRAKNDWAKVALEPSNRSDRAFNVIDVPETELIDALCQVVVYNRPTSGAQVDGAPYVSPLPLFLTLCVSYPTTPAQLRLALRRRLTSAEDVVVILSVLESWIAQYGGTRGAGLVPSKRHRKKKHEHKKKHEQPDLLSIVTFLQALLDATYFTILLPHVPAHRVLRRIAQLIEPEVAFIDEVEQLRGPLELFVRAAQEDANKKGATGSADMDRQRQQRQSAKIAHDMGVGMYRLEQLIF
ncbi:hypothetical protein FISHEDRAFT_71704 [Fistulina hepatica ATCC 64428]|uniref:Uncharacterized protein n=1 Tax=Fistulina hepatica ATCC 64428 TaxID=1128425 RepID=A0A0D7AK05_9AGAR|nr:hypothetical protein FISHEDRAFT_71704 [Fistulina hepatica ATCC 64428]